MAKDWKKISKQRHLGEDFIIENADKLVWWDVLQNNHITTKILATCAQYIDFDYFLNFGNPTFLQYEHTEDFLRDVFAVAPSNVKINNNTAWRGRFTANFVREFRDRFYPGDHVLYIRRQERTWNIITEFIDYFTYEETSESFYHTWVTEGLLLPHPFEYVERFWRSFDYDRIFTYTPFLRYSTRKEKRFLKEKRKEFQEHEQQ